MLWIVLAGEETRQIRPGLALLRARHQDGHPERLFVCAQAVGSISQRINYWFRDLGSWALLYYTTFTFVCSSLVPRTVANATNRVTNHSMSMTMQAIPGFQVVVN
jgi:hypothetical protein